jgi:tRNA(fMet)-specific endonuclease VapC
MTRFLPDTGVAGDFVFGRHGIPERVRLEVSRGNRIGITYQVLGELWHGVELSASRDRNAVRLNRAVKEITVWPFDRLAAEMYGQIAAHLRRVGRPMQAIDVQIASVALTLGRCRIVTRDSDFQSIPGLDIENWDA